MLNLSCHFVQKGFNTVLKLGRVGIMRKFLIFIVLTISGLSVAFLYTGFNAKSHEYEDQAFKHQFVIVEANRVYGFNLVDPEQSPPALRNSVMRGYRLFMNTPFYARDYARNQLSCTSCHLSAGNTIGGKNGGISLVGVTTSYPQYSKRDQKVISIKDRINNCFQRSMNGYYLPKDSPVMVDLVNYLEWISKEVQPIKNIPWLGLAPLKTEHKADPAAGAKVYTEYCAACHQPNGEGGGLLDVTEGKSIPSLWGVNSFNNGAGMCVQSKLETFVYLNMPYQQAGLTEAQARDVAAFVIQQPRPHFDPKLSNPNSH
jgi:thiosulfate dehydrogenase